MTEDTPEAQSTSKPTKTAITMVLDRSGSMDACRDATIESVNAYLTKTRADQNLKDSDFELAIFDTEAYDVIRRGDLVATRDIARDEFEPRSGTPLLDAVGRGIDGLDRRARDDNAILVVVTDGLENSSRKHTYESIKALLDERQKKGWLVLFLGAGLESAREGIRMGVSSVNVASVGTSEAQLRASLAAMAEANAVYAAAPSRPARAMYVDSDKFAPGARMAMGDSTGGRGLLDAASSGLKKKFFNRKPSGATMPKAPPAREADTWSGANEDAWRK